MELSPLLPLTLTTSGSHHHKPGKGVIAFFFVSDLTIPISFFNNFRFYWVFLQSSDLPDFTSLLIFCSRLPSARPCISWCCDPKPDSVQPWPFSCYVKETIILLIFWDILLQNISYKMLHIQLHFNLSSQLNRMSFTDYEVSSIIE